MYKNHQRPNAELEDNEKVSEVVVSEKPVLKADISPGVLKELLEKNLKWSQIIYEQNRRTNSKLFWIAFANWFKILLFVGVFVWSLVILSPFMKSLFASFDSLIGNSHGTSASATSSLKNILPLLPLDPAQKKQLESFLK